jgi:GAF domain-containing protein
MADEDSGSGIVAPEPHRQASPTPRPLAHVAGTEDATAGELAAYAALNLISFADQSLTETLGKVAELAKQTMSGHPEVSVTLLRDDRPRTAAFTGPSAAHLDERQYERGFGPCLDAAVAGGTIALAVDDPGQGYADFRAVAHREGVSHTLSVGLPVATRTVGALNLYSTTGPFLSGARRVAETFAGFAAVLLVNVSLYHDAADLAAQLQDALQSRAIIDQAKGIVMAQQHCDAEEAFRRLARLSQQQNVKLRVLAEALVRRTSRG